MRWRDLDDKNLPPGVTHWRRFRFWNKSLGLKSSFDKILQNLNNQRKIDLNMASILVEF